MKARGLASPDLGDCLAITFAVPHLQVIARPRALDEWDEWARRDARFPVLHDGGWMY